MPPISPLPVRLGSANAYLIPARDGYVLVDTGDPFTAWWLDRTLARWGIVPEAIRLIVITHAHADHVGGLAAIKRRSGAPVMAHRSEVALIEQGTAVAPPGIGLYGKAWAAVTRVGIKFLRVEPCAVEVAVDDEASLEDYGVAGRVLHTPGHTIGSTSVLVDGDAFVGDLCVNGLRFIRGPGLPLFGDDVPTIHDSWRRVLAAGAKTIYPAHGAPFAAENLRPLLRRRQ